MLGDFVVFPARGGWALKVDGAATAILEYETRDEAASIGALMAARRGVSLVIRDEDGVCAQACAPLESVAFTTQEIDDDNRERRA